MQKRVTCRNDKGGVGPRWKTLFGFTKLEPDAIPPSKTGKMAAGFDISSPVPFEV